tara:strand:+ start:2842 stop:3108 length:267 start_codon:yes stop_codon:yes gene_type:complete
MPRTNDRRVPTVERIKARLGKTRMAMVEEVVQDSSDSVIEVVLKDGYKSTLWNETMHVFGLHNFADYTQSEYFEELLQWFVSVEKVTK